MPLKHDKRAEPNQSFTMLIWLAVECVFLTTFLNMLCRLSFTPNKLLGVQWFCVVFNLCQKKKYIRKYISASKESVLLKTDDKLCFNSIKKTDRRHRTTISISNTTVKQYQADVQKFSVLHKITRFHQ